MVLSRTTGELPWAFGKGSQARIEGKPVWENPFSDVFLAGWWDKGWWDVQDNWGRDAKWPVIVLPRIKIFNEGPLLEEE